MTYRSEQPLAWSAQFGPSLTNSFEQPQNNDEMRNPEGYTRLRSPIPSDPGYGKDVYPRGTGYVLRLHGSEAKQNYKRATTCHGAPFLLNLQYSDLFHKSKNAGKPLKNHLNENAKRIRRIMRETQRKETVKEQSKPIPVKALWQSKQYDHVESKVKQKLDEDTQRSSSRPQSVQGNFLRAHENTGAQVLRSQSARGSVASSINLIKTQTNSKTKPDFVKINSRYVKNMPKPRKTASTEAVEQAYEKQEKKFQAYHDKTKGHLPDYIEKIKEDRDSQAYEARINAPDPECPPGHVKVDNNQRATTLQQLQSNRTVLEKRLLHLPVRNDTVTLRRTKDQIEKKIVELDQAIEIFSKPKVFIKIDE